MLHKMTNFMQLLRSTDKRRLGMWMLASALLVQAEICTAQSTTENLWTTLKPVIDSTYLIDIKQGSELSTKTSDLLAGSFETSQGEKVLFKSWYKTNWTDMRAVWMTEIHPNLGLIWGFSTGEKAEKYEITKSMTIGFAFNKPLDKYSYLSIKGTTIVGGNLKEKTCTADYGAIGGVQTVNCRLAATTLAPSDTLPFLFNDKPVNKNIFLISYTKLF